MVSVYRRMLGSNQEQCLVGAVLRSQVLWGAPPAGKKNLHIA